MAVNTVIKIESWSDIRELVLMCIGTDKGTWWADPDFGSELWMLRQEGKVDSLTAGRVKQMILDCLAWMKNDKIVSEIECYTERAGKNEIEYLVTIIKPNGDSLSIKEIWDAIK